MMLLPPLNHSIDHNWKKWEHNRLSDNLEQQKARIPSSSCKLDYSSGWTCWDPGTSLCINI